MSTSNATHTPSEFQVSPPALSSLHRIVKDRPILLHLERTIKQLDPPATKEQFWHRWNAIEQRLAQTFDGNPRPEVGTDHDRAWHHLFVQYDDVMERVES